MENQKVSEKPKNEWRGDTGTNKRNDKVNAKAKRYYGG
jgi:hypothetical protein